MPAVSLPIRKLGLPLLALALVGLFSLLPVFERLRNALDDSVLHWMAQPSRFEQTVVVDIDDASLRDLKRQLGSWPYPRDVYALLISYLRDAGAKAIVFDVVFADASQGDDAFALALAQRGDVVLAASGLHLPLEKESFSAESLQRLTLPATLDAGATSWPSMMLPTPKLLSSLPRMGGVGVISAPLDADRRLRRLPLMHDSNGRLFPALSVAAHLIEQPQASAALSPEKTHLSLNSHRWPIDASGKALVLLPSNASSIPTVAFSKVAFSALGASDDQPLRMAFAGRTVFVGSSSFLDDTVATPQGDLSGTALLANAYVSLGRDDVLRVAPWPLQMACLLLGFLPFLRGPKGGVGRDIALTGVALVSAGMLMWGLLGLWRIWVSPLPALLSLVVCWVLCAFVRRREQVLRNQSLDNERRVANAANAAKSQFLAHVSHELRTPLNAVLGMAEVLMRTELTAEQRGYVNIFQHAGGLLSALLDDLLDLSKIEADRLQLNPHAFSLHELIVEQIDLLKPRAVAKGISLTHSIDSQVIDVVLGDAKRLTQVLVNLMGNAIKFTSEGGVRVSVTVDADAQLCFSIRDSGIGIAASKLALIFEPFAQAEAGVSRYYGGTGLGLSISKRLIELMGGRIWVESEPGMGSTFRFVLALPPSSTLPSPLPGLAEPAAPRHGLHEEPHVGVCILLAEDNEINVLVIEAMLQKTPHTLHVASNGEVAVEMFKTGDYGLVLMDVQMPVMDGLQATRDIRLFEAAAGLERTHIVALTAGAYREDETLSREAGCDAHIGKPVAQQRLLDAIASLGRKNRNGPGGK